MNLLKNLAYIILSVFSYFVLQIIGSTIEFGVFGSGAAGDAYKLLIPITMVIIQIVITIILKLKRIWTKNQFVFTVSLLIPVLLLTYYYFMF